MTKVIMVTTPGRECQLLPDLTPLREVFGCFGIPWEGARNIVNGDRSLEEEDMDRKLIEFSSSDEVMLASFPKPPEKQEAFPEAGESGDDGKTEIIQAILEAKAALDKALEALGVMYSEDSPF